MIKIKSRKMIIDSSIEESPRKRDRDREGPKRRISESGAGVQLWDRESVDILLIIC